MTGAPAAFPAREWEHLYRRPGPWCSVFVDASTGTVDSLRAGEVGPGNVVDELRRQDAAEDDVRAVTAALEPATGEPNPTARLVLAESGEVRLDELLVGTEARPGRAVVGPVPDLLPLLRRQQHRFPYLVVDARRDGGEVRAHAATGGPPVQAEVSGTEENLTKNPRGGRSQGHYQQRTEEIWRRNSAELAEAVEQARQSEAARLIVVVGDTRAGQLLIDNLPAEASGLCVRIDLIPDGSAAGEEALRERTEALVAQRQGEGDQELLERLRQARGQSEPLAVTGVEAVVGALQQSQVETLVLTDEEDERRLTVLDAEPWVAVSEEDRYGSTAIGEAAASSALLRAAALTDADVALLPSGALAAEGLDEVAAVLRWPANP